MSDTPVTHIGDNSPEEVAFKLMLAIGRAESKAILSPSPTADREWILNTYADCLVTVKNPFNRASKPKK